MNTIEHLGFCTPNHESSGIRGTAQCFCSLPASTQATGLEPLAGTGTGVSASDSDGAEAGGCFFLPSFNVMPEREGRMALGQNNKGMEVIHHGRNSKYRVTRG